MIGTAHRRGLAVSTVEPPAWFHCARNFRAQWNHVAGPAVESSGHACRHVVRQPLQETAIAITARKEFEDLLAEEIPHLRRYARALTGGVDTADDLVQDCLERALRKRALWRPGGRLRSWLFRMLYRLYLNRRKRAAVEQRTLEHERGLLDASPATDRVAAHIEAADVVQALTQLPHEQRAAIVLIALEDVNYREAAWILGVRVGTLRSRLSRGREALRRLSADETAAPPLRSVK